MDYTIYPYAGVGLIKFGMTPEQVYQIVGKPDDQLPVNQFRQYPKDVYDRLEVFISYSNSGKCEAITSFDTTNTSFQDVKILGKSLKSLKQWLMSIGTDIQHFDIGFIALKFGIIFNSQNYNPDLNCECDSIIICDQDYCDKFVSLSTEYPREKAIV